MSNYATPLNGIDWTDSRAERMFLEQQARLSDHANSTPTLNKGPSNVTMSKLSVIHLNRINKVNAIADRRIAEQVVNILEFMATVNVGKGTPDKDGEDLGIFNADESAELTRMATELLERLDGVKPDIDPFETTDN